MLHMAGKANEIAPVRAIVLLFEMTMSRSGIAMDYCLGDESPFKPSMCIRRMKEIELPPCQRSSWGDGGVLSARLHTPDITNVLSLTVLTAEGRDCSNEYREQLDCFHGGQIERWTLLSRKKDSAWVGRLSYVI